jgi:aminoglycoside phosphotransferase (APT) family kinase protein
MPNELQLVALIRGLLRLPNAHPVIPVGEGCDHWVFEVNGIFIARVRKHIDESTATSIEHEAALLEVVSHASPIPVPVVVAAKPDAGLIVFRRLPGISLLDMPPSNPLALAEPLAEFVAGIHAVPAAAVERLVTHDEYPLRAYLSEAHELIGAVITHLTSAQQKRLEVFLASPAPPEADERTFCHNDLGAEHILASRESSELTGVIDWSDAAIADPARDIGRLLRDFGFRVAETVLRRTGGDERTLARAAFYARCALIEDLAHGSETSRPQYVAHALSRFAETFS